jgi:MFS family permease
MPARALAVRSPSRGGTVIGATPRRSALIALCITQITGYGVLYYAFPVMLTAVARDTGWSTAAAMGAFSAGAIVSAAAGVIVGRLIDSRGPRPVMTTGSILGVLAVAAIAAAPNLIAFYAAWVLAGIAQSAVLYPPAFAALTGWYGPDRVRALTTLTLAAGFASTIFAPLTAALLDHLTWRYTYLVLGAILAVVTIPLHAVLLTPPWAAHARTPTDPGQADRAHASAVMRSRSFITLAAAVTLAAFGMYAATVNLVPLLTARGMGTHLAALTLGLCGAGQVLGRLGYPAFSARVTFTVRAFTVLVAGAATILLLALLPGPAAALIAAAIVAGAVRGLLTLLQATAVADLWGTRAFGRINGVFAAPITTAIALAPGGGVLLADLTGRYPTSLTILAFITLAAAVAAATSRKTASTGHESTAAGPSPPTINRLSSIDDG